MTMKKKEYMCMGIQSTHIHSTEYYIKTVRQIIVHQETSISIMRRRLHIIVEMAMVIMVLSMTKRAPIMQISERN